MLTGIFDMFTQGGQSQTGGLGIGLTLVKRLVEMHGGTVTAESDGLGTGSTFVIRLPVVVEAVHAPRTADGEPAHVGASSLHIMVVGENPDAAVSLATLLRSS